jgi:hypothetical protein
MVTQNMRARFRFMVTPGAVFCLIPIVGITALVLWSAWQFRAMHNKELMRSRAQLQRQIDALNSDGVPTIHLYDTVGTDDLLSELAHVNGVEALTLELTDASNEGMRSVSQIAQLKSLVLYGGRPGIGNEGLRQLKGLSSLERLELINTKVSDDGLASLMQFPNLRSLCLFSEPWRQERFTDAALEHLSGIPRLETLQLRGGWASERAIDQLRRMVPNCDVQSSLELYQDPSTAR